MLLCSIDSTIPIVSPLTHPVIHSHMALLDVMDGGIDEQKDEEGNTGKDANRDQLNILFYFYILFIFIILI